MEIPQFELERLARFLLPRILKFYENEENQKPTSKPEKKKKAKDGKAKKKF